MKEALELAQKYYRVREQRLAADKVAAEFKETETGIKQQLMDLLEASGINSVGDKVRVYALVTKDEPEVADWSALYQHIQQTGAFELIYKRVNPAAVKERWEQNIAIPGVRKYPSISLSVTKAKGAK